jgi:hypothetical protein
MYALFCQFLWVQFLSFFSFRLVFLTNIFFKSVSGSGPSGELEQQDPVPSDVIRKHRINRALRRADAKP